jgi:hypothetical protein
MMIDAAYYRRQAATCRAMVDGFRHSSPLLDLAEYFERLAKEIDAPSEEGRYRRPGEVGGGRPNLVS